MHLACCRAHFWPKPVQHCDYNLCFSVIIGQEIRPIADYVFRLLGSDSGFGPRMRSCFTGLVRPGPAGCEETRQPYKYLRIRTNSIIDTYYLV